MTAFSTRQVVCAFARRLAIATENVTFQAPQLSNLKQHATLTIDTLSTALSAGSLRETFHDV
jgi:hypothetical protein